MWVMCVYRVLCAPEVSHVCVYQISVQYGCGVVSVGVYPPSACMHVCPMSVTTLLTTT